VRRLCALVICVICLTAEVPHPKGVWSISGSISCATWLADPISENQGIYWLFGYFTGRNVESDGPGMVGHGTDSQGIIAEVKLICEKSPSTLLGGAAHQVYNKLRDEGR
jgi:hypothetical protein